MASEKLTQYERKRLENIKRNAEMVSALNIHSKAATLSAATKRQKREASTVKKPTTENPSITKKSLRTRGMPPSSAEADGLLKPISMVDAYKGVKPEYNQVLVETVLSIAKETQVGFDGVKASKDDNFSGLREKGTLGSSRSKALKSLDLKPESVTWVAPGRIMVVKFFPCSSMRMIAAGNNFGSISFWNVDCEDENHDSVHVYRPHTGQISGILIQQHSISKIYSSGYDGFIRLMDAEKEVFDLAHSCDDAIPIYSLSQPPNNPASLYFGRRGGLNVWDTRTGKSSKNWMLHGNRINTISFNSKDPNIMATSSADGTASIWDLRTMSSVKPEALKTVRHTGPVHSAYFSPSGNSLATTSVDKSVGVISGVSFEDTCMIHHDNSPYFRGVWGWDDSYIFIGNMKEGVDVISPTQKGTVMTLQSPQGSTVPYRFDTHPYEVGMLAGATNGGQICLWKPS